MMEQTAEKKDLLLPQQSPGPLHNEENESSISISINSPPKPQSPNSCENSANFSTTTNDGSPIELPEVDENGRLDLSGRALNKLSRKSADLTKLNRPIRSLNISKCSLRSVDFADLPLEQCAQLDASQNELSQLRAFLPLCQTLTNLNLSDNRITSCQLLNSFLNLQSLDLSHNRIEHIPLLDQLTKLASLNLSSNHLKTIPNLSKLSSLTELSMFGNSIRTLADIQSILPIQSLRFLDLGGNLVDDLTEMHFLHGFKALESLTVLGNICTKSDNPHFSYRPFAYSCVLGDLKILDGSCLSEQEMIKGEWLHTQGSAHSFRPGTGAHTRFCDYLAKECPLLSAEVQLGTNEDDEKLKKVIQKRREYRNEHSKNQQEVTKFAMAKSPRKTTTTMLECAAERKPLVARRFNTPIQKTPATKFAVRTTPSYSAVINAKNAQKIENSKIADDRPTSNSQDAIAISASSTAPSSPLSSRTVTLSKSEKVEIRSPPPAGRSAIHSPLTSRLRTTSNRGRPQIGAHNSKIPHKIPTRLTTPAVMSPADNAAASTNTLHDFPLASVGKKKTSVGGFRSILARKLRRSSANQNASTASTESTLRFQQIQKRIDHFAQQNSMLTAINEDHVRTFVQFQQKLQQLEGIIAHQAENGQKLRDLLMPTPTNLKYELKEDNKLLISWENVIPLMNSIDHYELYLNNKQTGRVLARSKRILITDTDPEEEYNVSVQAFISKLDGGVHSSKGEVFVPARGGEEEGKENKREGSQQAANL